MHGFLSRLPAVIFQLGPVIGCVFHVSVPAEILTRAARGLHVFPVRCAVPFAAHRLGVIVLTHFHARALGTAWLVFPGSLPVSGGFPGGVGEALGCPLYLRVQLTARRRIALRDDAVLAATGIAAVLPVLGLPVRLELDPYFLGLFYIGPHLRCFLRPEYLCHPRGVPDT